ncbi:hypothetical protein PVA45_07455 (plasmid) [Entomospira entomophila]|uniref:Toxic anion resistance protein n=1 Tax=Entomospira entomophila TaxID=2719988 RepID=A0A968GE09_9SPIO|nr:hypothetical protein [Entomospira entomophilus]NIZ41304.1 hypothetical protein [Entomospira entomophilus]WDI36173.1 hypothetical protein PVA45_07455 [Entomospira entomophilus]
MSARDIIISYLENKNITKIDEIGTNTINSIKPVSNDILNIIAKRTYAAEKEKLTSVNEQAKEALASLEPAAAPTPDRSGLIPKLFNKLAKTLFTGEAPTVDKADLKAIDITNNLEAGLYKINDNLKTDEKELFKFNTVINKAIGDLQKINDEVRAIINEDLSATTNPETWSALVEKNADLTTQIGVFKTITMSIENQLKINKNLQRTTHKSIHQILPIWRSVVANSLSGQSLNSVAECAKQTNDALDMFLEKSVMQQQELTNTVRELEHSKQELPKKIVSYLDMLNEIQHEIEDIYVQAEKDRITNTKMLQDKMDFLSAQTIDVAAEDVKEENLLL